MLYEKVAVLGRNGRGDDDDVVGRVGGEWMGMTLGCGRRSVERGDGPIG
jgi:hypothetical protein